MENKHIFAFFPYIKTSNPISHPGILIRSIDDTADLPADVVQHLETLHSMFFLYDEFRIKNMSYAFHASEGDEMGDNGFISRVLNFQTLIRYIYSAPHPIFSNPFLTYEHASLYLFRPKRVSKHFIVTDYNVENSSATDYPEVDKRDHVEGYEVFLNNRSFLVTKGSRIYPPVEGRLWLNISQDLYVDLNHRRGPHAQLILESFMDREKESPLDKRILTALNWYNRSIKIDIDEEMALVNLAIAFESLLGLKSGENVTDRFKEAVTLLVGGVDRLDSWLQQFYNARSKILHEGESQHLIFQAIDNPNKKSQKAPELLNRSLVSYGRQVFQVCIGAVLTGARMAEKMKLSSMLVTNRKRFERICATLSNRSGTPAERIMSTSQDVREVETYRFIGETDLTTELLIGTTKLMITQFLDSDPSLSPQLVDYMKDFSNVDSTDHYQALSLLEKIEDEFQILKTVNPASDDDLLSIVTNLVESVWHYTFTEYYRLQRSHEKGLPT